MQGLGKTLTVISLILTNHWDGRPLAKPELGYTRPALTSATQKRARPGRAAAGGKKFNPKSSAAALGVGSKVGGAAARKTSVAGLFDKFNKSSSESEAEKENRKGFKFSDRNKNGVKNKKKEKDFIDESDESDDEFSLMSKKNIFKTSSRDLFKKVKNPVEDSSDESGVDNNGLSSEDLMKSMVPTAFDDSDTIDPKLNLDGCFDESSSDEEDGGVKGKRKMKGEKSKPQKKLKPSNLSDSESELPSPEVRESGAGRLRTDQRGEPSKPGSNRARDGDSDSGNPGLTRIVPPREPAERAGRARATLIVCPTSLISHWLVLPNPTELHCCACAGSSNWSSISTPACS